ncbi:MAG: hypothetical protein ACRDKA_11115 [Actinomycetota bacterium]
MDRVDPRLVDAALEGRETGEPALDRAAQLVADLRRVLLEEPLPEAAAGHLEAMSAAAGDEARGSTPVLSRRRAARRRRLASMPLAAVLVLGAGLAWGAVTLPDQASDVAEEAVAAAQERANGGAETEDAETEDEGTEGATHGQEVSEVAQDDSLQGCEKGMAVSEVASSKGNKQGPKQDPCAKGDQAGGEGQARGQEASAKGKQTAEDAKAKGTGGGGPPEDAGSPQEAGPPEGAGTQGKGKS